MPAPPAIMMQTFAKQKFASFNLKVPQNWQDPQGSAGDHYGRAFKPEEKGTTPAMGAPLLFQAASRNKYHTDTQKMLCSKFGSFIDGICSAVCSAWSQWHSLSTMVGFVVAGPTVSAGQIVGPPLYPLIMASAPKANPSELKYSNVIAQVIGTAWLTYTATIKLAGMPLFPAYSALAVPVAPPMPHMPVPIAQFINVPVSVTMDILKGQKIAMLGDPQAQYAKELFESIAYAFDQCVQKWKTPVPAGGLGTSVANLIVIATGGTPVSPIPAVGTATMPPGGIL